MTEQTTIDKKTFAVDMKIVWACAAALVYGANMAADWRNKVENHMAQQAATNAQQTAVNTEIRKTPERVGIVERDVEGMKATIKEIREGQARTEAKIDELATAFGGFKRSMASEIGELKGHRK